MKRLAIRALVPFVALSAAVIGALPATAAPVEYVNENGFAGQLVRGETRCVTLPVSRPYAPYQEVEYQFNTYPNAGTFTTHNDIRTTEFWRPISPISPGQTNFTLRTCATNSVPNLQDPLGRVWMQAVIIYRATPVGAVAVNVNQPGYVVGNSPYYYVSGPPNSPIYWSSTRNGVSTGENDTFYGQYTDGNGYWHDYGGAWQPGQSGDWTKTVTIGGTASSVSFHVS